jgi:O-6-methylguanine DNA methyltransferase
MPEYFQDYLNTPLGLLAITATDQFVLGVDFVKRKNKILPNKITKLAKQELAEYFQGTRKKFSVPILLQGTVWQSLVWQKLLSVPYANVISYQDLAKAVGKDQAARAIGGAVNKNPIAIIVPCHRVVGSSGDLVGYAGGLAKKKYLLNLENNKNL